MFGTLLASQLPAMAWRRPALVAVLMHGMIIAAAAGATRKAVKDTHVAERDTIRLDLQLSQRSPRAPAREALPSPGAPSAPSLPPSDLSGPPLRLDLPIPRLPSIPEIVGRHSLPTGGGAREVLWDSAFSVTDVDRLPELTTPVLPDYPPALRSSGLSGLVELEYVISSNGRIDSTTMHVVRSSHPLFSRAAVGALLPARFRPALRQGRPVPVRVRQAIRFVTR